ncbi:MAG: Gfo/Idh/MocA family oxidoreductase [Phycisphaerae bacterium]|nr:Gfo/Idh/MocA family oxidoreductase [Phycisphaerae bacterium]
MRVHRLAMVGCGAFAKLYHLPIIRANPRARLAVACDLNLDAAKECADRFNAGKATADWREVIGDPDVDAIILATHTNLRGELIIPALQAGKPVFVEKPVANTDAEMVEIVRAGRENGVPVCVDHNRRSSPAIHDLYRLLEKARKGPGGHLPSVDRSDGGQRPAMPQEKQTQILIRVNDDCRSWVDWALTDAEGILFAEMVHFIDVAMWLMTPSPITRVFVEGSAQGNFALTMRFADGSLATIQQTVCGHFDYPKELIEVTANHVTLAMEHHVELRQRGLPDEPFRRTYPFKSINGRLENGGIEAFHLAVTETFENTRRTGSPPVFISPDKGHAAHIDRFLDCIEGKGENPCDVVDAVRVTRVALKLLGSVRKEAPVEISERDWLVEG